MRDLIVQLNKLKAGLEVLDLQITNAYLQITSLDTYALIVEPQYYTPMTLEGWYGLEILTHLSFYPDLCNRWGYANVFDGLSPKVALLLKAYKAKQKGSIPNGYKYSY